MPFRLPLTTLLLASNSPDNRVDLLVAIPMIMRLESPLKLWFVPETLLYCPPLLDVVDGQVESYR